MIKFIVFKMKWNLNDLKAFGIGVVASITAVIVWDVIKHRYKIFDNTREIAKQVEKEL